MTDPEKLDYEAEEWLKTISDELLSEPIYRYGPYFYDRLCFEISTYDPPHRESIIRVLDRWLRGEDPDLAHEAAYIAFWCKITVLAGSIRELASRCALDNRFGNIDDASELLSMATHLEDMRC